MSGEKRETEMRTIAGEAIASSFVKSIASTAQRENQ